MDTEPQSIVGQHGLKGEPEIRPLSRAQETLVRRAAETRATVPDLELGVEVNAGRVKALAEQHDGWVTPVLIRACALALADHPYANGAYRDGHHELYPRINIAVTIQTDGGYVAPTLLDADTKSLPQLGAELEQALARAHAGELRSPELAGATFTLTDLGAHAIQRVTPLLTPPQAAAIAAGAITAAPVVTGEGTVVAGHALVLTLAADARILYGARAAAFLADVAQRLERGDL